MKEIWRNMPGYLGYKVSNKSRVIGLRGWIMKPYLDKNNYYRFCLKGDGVAKYMYRSRMVALTWIENPENKKEVNHKNGVTTDDSIPNLEWATPSENINHYYYTLKKGAIRRINQYDMNGNFIREWPSISQAARSVNGSTGNITITCQGKNYYAYGFKWAYVKG